jgi:hypothetical protein
MKFGIVGSALKVIAINFVNRLVRYFHLNLQHLTANDYKRVRYKGKTKKKKAFL